MKGLSGLIIAGILGLLGIALNWFYLENKSRSLEMVAFLGIREGVTIENGDTFSRSHFESVQIPRKHAGNLEDYVYLWNDAETVIGVKAIRNYTGGELFFKQDYRTPQLQVQLGVNERLLPISVSERSPLIQPGHDVSFWIPTDAGTAEVVGPFRIGAIGNQVGSADVMRAYRIPHVLPNQLGIIVEFEGGDLEQRARSLLEKIQDADGRGIKVILHPEPTD